MSKSDYSYIAFNTKGEQTDKNGEFGIISIEPYKTWLYLHSDELWRENMGFVKNTIAQINEGEINISGISITVKSVDLKNKDGVPYHTIKLFYCSQGWDDKTIRFGGIVCYAYLNYEAKFAQDMGIPADWYISSGSSNCHPLDESKNEKSKYWEFIECMPPLPEGDAPKEEWDKCLEQKKVFILNDYPEMAGKNWTGRLLRGYG